MDSSKQGGWFEMIDWRDRSPNVPGYEDDLHGRRRMQDTVAIFDCIMRHVSNNDVPPSRLGHERAWWLVVAASPLKAVIGPMSP